jgi:Cu2+-exporting ATPase
MSTSLDKCTLCSLEIGSVFSSDSGEKFCCKGCKVVYQILKASGQQTFYQNSNIFRQAVSFGLISNQELSQQPVNAENKEFKRAQFEIEGMICPSCKDLIEIVLGKIRGIKKVFIDYALDIGTIEFYPMQISLDEIFLKISSFGYNPKKFGDKKTLKVSKELYLRLAVASFASLNIMMFSYPIYEKVLGIDTEGFDGLFGWLSFFLTLPIMFYCLTPIFKKAFLGMKFNFWGMESLITIGSASSFVLSLYALINHLDHIYFDTLSMIAVFALWGRSIEYKAKKSATEKLFELQRQLPKKVRVKDGEGNFYFKPLKEMDIGDVFYTFTGEKIVSDGLIVEGKGSVDESLLTGEPDWIFKEKNDKVIGGSFLCSGNVCIKVTKKIEETLYYRIVELLKLDLNPRKNYTGILEHLLKFFVPFILFSAFLIALIVYPIYGFQESFLRFLSLLLISCPCALSISFPLVEAILILKLTKLGVIVRDREALRKLPVIDVIAFDKTGTLTEGKFKILSKLDLSSEYRRILKGLSSFSNHPVCVAINQCLEEQPLTFNEIEEVVSRGVKGKRGDDLYLLGSKSFINSHGIDTIEDSDLYFVKNTSILQTIRLDDPIKKNAKTYIDLIPVKEKIVLSGDRLERVASICKDLGIKNYKALYTAFDKRGFIEECHKNKKKVVMVGDGVNDSLSLSLADVSLSFTSGSELSCHISSAMLTDSSLSVLPKIFSLCSRARKLCRQNLFWAFFYNIMAIPLAAMGFFSPLVALTAMILSSFIVILNSKRL